MNKIIVKIYFQNSLIINIITYDTKKISKDTIIDTNI